MIQNKEYPRNTLGYHHQRAEKVFGEASAPVIWLDEQAEAAPEGYDAKANMTEEQVIQYLSQLHEDEARQPDPDEQGYVDEEDLEE